MTKKDGSTAILSIILCAMSLPPYKRYEIVFFAKNKYGPHFSSNKIVKIVNCNHKTGTKWLNRWNETKDLIDRPRSEAPRTTTVEQDQMMVDVALKETDTTSKSIKKGFKTLGIDISEGTVQRRLKNAALKYMKPLSKPLLSEWHREQRLSWAESMKNYNWN